MNRIINIIFWLAISAILLFIFGSSSGNFIYTFYFLVFFIPVTILTSWVFNSVLVPRYLLKGAYGRFALFSSYVFIISLDIEMILVFVAFWLIAKYDYENMAAIIDYYKWMPVLMYFIVIFIGFVGIVQQLIKAKRDIGARDSEEQMICVRSERKNRLIDPGLILYIESMSDYLNIRTTSGEVIVTRVKISKMEGLLPEYFSRIHRSYIVNDSLIESFSKEEVQLGGSILPISRSYKKSISEKYKDKAKMLS